MPLELKIKKLRPEAVLPKKAHDDDAGYDLTAIDDGEFSKDGTYIEYKTGLSFDIPEGYHIELFPRGSISKTDLVLANSIGLVDQNFKGELTCRFKLIPRLKNESLLLYKTGDRIGQLVVRKTIDINIQEVDTLSKSSRGSGAYGSSGN